MPPQDYVDGAFDSTEDSHDGDDNDYEDWTREDWQGVLVEPYYQTLHMLVYLAEP
jgi:hypothetical protein